MIFAPIVVIPPSPNNTPCTIRTRVRMNTAAKGEPRTIATSAPPTTWPLIPRGRGMLKDMRAKTAAARTATIGTFSSVISFFAQRRASATKTSATIQ
jgi:hypothetical protein